MASESDEGLRKSFPRLLPGTYRVTSPTTRQYNCIAWAARDASRWWWPFHPPPAGHWPVPPRDESVGAFVEAFAALGFALVDGSAGSDAVERIALFGDAAGDATHMARQLLSGRWTSKLGRGVDIEHELAALEGGVYGTVVAFLERPARLR